MMRTTCASSRQMIPLHPSLIPLSTLSASGFFVAAIDPAAASARRLLDQLAGIYMLRLTESATGPAVGSTPHIARVAAIFTRFS